jgi:hypothetical protein
MLLSEEDSPLVWMQQLIGDWLQQESWHSSDLLNWLQGFSLPPVGQDEEPYLWILRGLPLGDRRYKFEVELATRLATIIDDVEQVSFFGRSGSEKLAYNILMLAAGVSSPEQLADPLVRLFELDIVRGEWLGLDIRYCLQSALSENQLDDRLFDDWKRMLAEDRNATLPGTPIDGFNGIRLMPRSRDRLGEPHMEAIGYALTKTVGYLAHDDDRRTSLRALISKATETYPGSRDWDFALLTRADRDDWPSWAVDCLNLLFRTDRNRFVVWEVIYDLFQHKNYVPQIYRRFCNDQAYEIVVDEQLEFLLLEVGPTLERTRILNPYKSDRSAVGTLNHILLNEIESRLREIDPNAADSVSRLRRERIVNVGMAVASSG